MKTDIGRTIQEDPASPSEADAELVSLYQAHKKIYPRSVSGLFSQWRWGMVFLTQLVFYGLPWLEWGQRQMVLFDLGVRGDLELLRRIFALDGRLKPAPRTEPATNRQEAPDFVWQP
jgi:hypothetical protein